MVTTKKLVKELQEKVDHLSSLIESEEFKKLRKDSEELKEIKKLVSCVKFKIKSVSSFENQETNRTNIIVTYELPKVILELDEDGNPSKDDFFYASNMLNMISLEDMFKFQEFLKKTKK